MEVRELGVEQLKALTHPLRLAILRALRTDGPATATALAKRLGESSGATSYHLRQLERHGFVEEVPDSGDARDRWWRPAFSGHRVEPRHWLGGPEDRAVLATYQGQVVAGYADNAAQFVAAQGAGEWSDEWADVADFSDFRLRLTPARLRRLLERVHALVDSYAKYDEGEEVLVQLQAFPRRLRPFAEES